MRHCSQPSESPRTSEPRSSKFFSDSMLVMQYVKGEYEARDEGMMKYLQVVRDLTTEFTSWDINKILMIENSEADRLSKYASITIPYLQDPKEKVFVEYLPKKTTSTAHLEVLDLHEEALRLYWMDPILNYLKDGSLPLDRKEARSIIY